MASSIFTQPCVLLTLHTFKILKIQKDDSTPVSGIRLNGGLRHSRTGSCYNSGSPSERWMAPVKVLNLLLTEPIQFSIDVSLSSPFIVRNHPEKAENG